MITDRVLVSDRGNACAGLEEALTLVEKTARYCGYDDAQTARLRLMAEEMIAGCASILDVFSGLLWMETDEMKLTILLRMEGLFTQGEREKLVSLTRERKNTLPDGFFGKLGVLIGDALTGEYLYPTGAATDIDNAELLWGGAQITEMMAEMERQSPQDAKAEADAREALNVLADDITVSARASQVTLRVMKALPGKESPAAPVVARTGGVPQT